MGSRRGLHHVTPYTILSALSVFFTNFYTCYSNSLRFATISYDDLDTIRTSTFFTCHSSNPIRFAKVTCGDLDATASPFNKSLISPTTPPPLQSSGYCTSTRADRSLSKYSGPRTVRFHRDGIYYSPLRSRELKSPSRPLVLSRYAPTNSDCHRC